MPNVSLSARARSQVGHPVVDGDGHFLEVSVLFMADVASLVRELGGTEVGDRFDKAGFSTWDLPVGSNRDPRDRWTSAAPFWGWPAANTLDRATAELPRLLHERLDELGLDFTVLYPSHGLSFSHRLLQRHALDPELAQVVCRATNTIYSEMFRPYADRMTPVASVPMHTPEAAIEEAEYAVRTLGMKAIRIAGYAVRPIPAVQRRHPELLGYVHRNDTFGVDSEYDYDPFWAKCIELGVAPVAHTGLANSPYRSVSNYVFNHIGGLARANEALCKSLLLGGVTRRFPQLRVAFLEGGVGWACMLLADLVGHWEKRNVDALLQNLDPATLDTPLLLDLMKRYGTEDVVSRLETVAERLRQPQRRPPQIDDFAACRVADVDDLIGLFVPAFYFGCEGDDPTIPWAFSTRTNPRGARLNAMFGSDIGHWDVPDFTESFAEAYEQLEEGLLTEQDFCDFTFTNAVKLHGGMNPAFFDGTVVEAAARSALGSED